MDINQITVKMLLDRWNASLRNFDSLLTELSNSQLEREISTGKNRGIYVLGHVIAVHDELILLLDMGDKLFPALHEPFLKSADKATTQIPTADDLRDHWRVQCDFLLQKTAALSTAQWFEKHTAVSSEDFAKEPHRNKLNIILTRTTHLAYHTGQLVLLK
jgi:hypothetical protein